MDFEKLTGLGIGTWKIVKNPEKDEKQPQSLWTGSGINIIDTAEMYGEGKSEVR